MVWTLAKFKEETNIKLHSRTETVLTNIDAALRSYDGVRSSSVHATRRAALGTLLTAIDAWRQAKVNKLVSTRRAAIITLRNQVTDEIDRVDALINAEAMLALAIPPPRIEPPTISFSDDLNAYVYYDPNTNRTTQAQPRDWEIKNYKSSTRRYYRNKIVHLHRKVEPDDWDETIDPDTNRSSFTSLITGLVEDAPVELTPEILRTREIQHFVSASRWVPDDYYTIEEDVEKGGAVATMTPYRKNLSELNSDKEAIAPKVRRILCNGTLHLTIREDIQTAKLTSGPYSLRSKAPVDLAQIDAWEGARAVNVANLEEAKTLARRAVRLVRHFLPLGAFNNRGGVDPKPDTWSKNPGRDMQRLEQLAATLLGVSQDFLHAMACNGAAVRALGGGVCSMIGAFTAGLLSVISPPDTEIIYCYHSADHAYCVVSYKKSEWICADPWPLVPYPAKWAASYFVPRSDFPLKYYTKIDVALPVRIPFGLINTTVQSLEYSKVLDTALNCPGSAGEIGHPYGHLSNTGDGKAPDLYEGEKAIVKKKDWGPTVDYSAEFPELFPEDEV